MTSMFSDLRVVLATFPRRTRAQLLLVIAGQFVASLLDLLGLSVVLPLMQVVTGADLGTGYLAVVNELLGSPDRRTLVLYLSALMVLAFLFKTVASLLLQWISMGILNGMSVRTSARLLESFLREDYLSHRRRRTADLTRAVGVSVSMALGSVLGGLMSIFSQSLSLLLILAFLMSTMPVPTLTAIVYFGVSVLVMQRALMGPNRRAGEQASEASWKSFHALHDSMVGFREIRMHEAESYFLDRYRGYLERGTEAGRKANFFSQLPKQLLELITIIGLAALLVAIGATSTGSGELIPSLALFVAAAIRLLPVIAGMTQTMGAIAYGQEGLRHTAEVLETQPDAPREADDQSGPTALGQQDIVLQDVTFRYPDADEAVLRDISLQIPAGSSFALCGVSGSGKTTLVDIILGLIEPTDGQVLYGDQSVRSLGRSWREHVAYVPQDAFVMDAPLTSNIAFGLAPDDVDEARLEDAVRRAQLEDVVRSLPEGLDTLIGERGQRLSGGQRQRIGIARALYRNPQVVVLDEATSALDNATEHQISETLTSLHGDVTTIIVAHRLSTVRAVDQLAFIEDGRIVSLGSFEQVRAEAPGFDELVILGRLE